MTMDAYTDSYGHTHRATSGSRYHVGPIASRRDETACDHCGARHSCTTSDTPAVIYDRAYDRAFCNVACLLAYRRSPTIARPRYHGVRARPWNDGERTAWFVFPRTSIGRVVDKLAETGVCMAAYYSGPGRRFSHGPVFTTRGSRVLVTYTSALDV